jgi:drug/metabolite transporter (DMT)-like permease
LLDTYLTYFNKGDVMSNRDLLVAILVMAVWGLNFSVIKLGVNEADPVLVTALRFTFATFPAIFFVKRPDVKWRYLISYGLVFPVGVWGVATWSIDAGLSAGMASLLLQLNVFIAVFLGYFFLNESLSQTKLLGCLLAVSGLILSLSVTDGTVSLAGVLLILIAALCWSIASIIIKKAATKDVFAFTVWAMLFAPVPLFILAFYRIGAESFVNTLQTWNSSLAFSILFQAYPVTLLGYWIWNRILSKYPLSTVSPLTLLVPIFGLLGGVLFYNEQVESTKIISCLLILTGLMIGIVNPVVRFNIFNNIIVFSKFKTDVNSKK